MKSREEIRIQQGKLETENNVFKLNFNYIKSIDLIKNYVALKPIPRSSIRRIFP